ncbi:MAG: PDDEXK nuclease domain-containing protein [Bacilli bacterium]|nr:PDDEXK nuclease domain-containing protein [Bacilli bacterium]
MPNIVMNNEFKAWVSNISEKYKQAQIKAAICVNSEMLKFYFELGKEIANNSFKATYGSRFYDSLSEELVSNLPNVKGLSPKNIRYIEKFYKLYNDQVQNFPQLVGQLFSIPWGHHRYIIDKCKDVEKALFFVRKTHENNWSRDVLLNFISTDLYEREGKAINNFELALPDANKDLAKQITKDPYNFDFLAITNEYNEKELKDALIANIQKFLLELGEGFAFVGREHRMLVGETEFFTDLLFYNIKLHAYVVIEVKITKFTPGDLGQLSTYVSSVNHLLKGENDNPTIGILICKDKDKIVAEYSLENYNIPLGISSYELNKLLPKELKNSLPSIEELERKLGE